MTRRDDTSELVAVLAACEAAQGARVPWWQIARTVSRLGSADALLSEPWEPADRWEQDVAVALAHHLRSDARERWASEVEEWREAAPELQFITITAPEFPIALGSVFNPPPFLVMRGDLIEADARGVAVVGTRKPTPEGITRAKKLGRGLAEAGVTVYSGLARGIDTAAHAGALEADGRTVAVLGHGLLHPYYPKENAELAASILGRGGAVVSQFRPSTPPSQYTFPMRNVVMSGLAQGTVVVEASQTSGARLQARVAAEQGRRVWFLRSLVQDFEWARTFVHQYPVRVIDEVQAVVDELADAEAMRKAAEEGVPAVASAEEARRKPATSDDPLVLFR
jgi:DNA processing protein